MPSLPSYIFQSTLVTTFAATAGFFVYTKHCHFNPVSNTTDPIFQNKFYRKFNPRENPVLHDLCVRKIPLFKVKKELREDAAKGGGKLVESYVAGVWGNFGALVQRQYLSQKYSKDPDMQHMLFKKGELLVSPYDEETDILNHFRILSKTPTTILIRAGDSPLNSPSDPRSSDGLLELTARADLDHGFAEFTFRSVFFSGDREVPEGEKPMGQGMEWAHRQYTKLLVETGIKNCMG